MYTTLVFYLLLLKTVHSTTVQTNKLIQDICDKLKNGNELELIEDQQWKIICQELFLLKEDDQYVREKRDINKEETSTLADLILRKAGSRGGGGSIRGGGSRGGSIRVPSGGGSRSSSGARYRNVRTGSTITRPSGWQWSRSRFVFLPIATRYFHRSRSSSNRYTTPASSSSTYYYCTSADNNNIEIQCDSTYEDNQCCEDTSTGEAFCCGGKLPDDLLEDMNRATQSFTRIFYTLSIIALFMHFFMRHFYHR